MGPHTETETTEADEDTPKTSKLRMCILWAAGFMLLLGMVIIPWAYDHFWSQNAEGVEVGMLVAAASIVAIVLAQRV